MPDNTQTQPDIMSILQQWVANGGNQPPNNVAQGSSPEVTSDSASIGPQGNGGNFGGGNSGPQDEPQLHPIQQAAIDAAVSTTKKQVQEAVQHGGPSVAKHIVDTFGGGGNPTWGNQPQPSQPQPQQILQNLVNPNGQQQQTQPQSIDDQIANINKQAQLNLAQRNLAESKPPDFLQRFSQQFAKMSGGVTQADQLGNIETMQKIAGGEPLQPKDVGELNARTYGAALDATHQSAALEAQKLPQLLDLYGKLNLTKGIPANIGGTTSTDQRKTLMAIRTAGQSLNTHIENLGTLINNRPTFSSKGMDKQAQQTSNRIEGAIYKDANGNQAKYVNGQYVPIGGK